MQRFEITWKLKSAVREVRVACANACVELKLYVIQRTCWSGKWPPPVLEMASACKRSARIGECGIASQLRFVATHENLAVYMP